MTIRTFCSCLVIALVLAAPASAQSLTDAERSQIDSAATAALEATGSPGASIAIVRGGQIVYERAYGIGRVDPPTPAKAEMRYAIGSVSKQFTATAILMLQEEGRLSLDDRVRSGFPN
jgi:CubicO group peptidase (beta-lactamase class C family)